MQVPAIVHCAAACRRARPLHPCALLIRSLACPLQAGGVAVDLGAQWIHGREGNQVHADIIRPQGMRCVDTPYDDTVFTQAAGGGWGEMSSAQYSAMEGLYGELESHIAARQNAANDASLRATIDAFVTSRPALTAQQRQWLNFSATSSIEHEYRWAGR